MSAPPPGPRYQVWATATLIHAWHQCVTPPLTVHKHTLRPSLSQVIVHTGDAWGKGCTSELAFEVIGTHGRLLSQDCKVVEMHGTTDRHQRVVEYAQSLEWPKDSSGLQVGKAEKVGRSSGGASEQGFCTVSERLVGKGGNPRILVHLQD